jgi:parallel beta-helix repeat protein
MNIRMRKIAALLAGATAVTLPTIAGAQAQVNGALACGQTITQSTTLTANVGPCSNNGIIVGANNITLNLNNFRIFGTPNSGDGAGVLLQGRSGVTVQGGTVTDFDGGVVILGGSGNTVTGITARNNRGAAQGTPGGTALYGDGILVQGSPSNRIVNNVADNNGPFSGIGVIRGDGDHPAIPPADAPFNLIQGNTVTNNVACRRSGTSGFCDNDGIRIEPNVTDSRIMGNTVTGNGLDGISLFGGTTRNVVWGNNASSNGYFGAVAGDGIRVFGSGNFIDGNTTNGNKAAGISVARRTGAAGSFPATNPNGRNNTLRGNQAFGNLAVDLWDSNRNPDCDNNVWRNNNAGTAVPVCTRNG